MCVSWYTGDDVSGWTEKISEPAIVIAVLIYNCHVKVKELMSGSINR